MSMNIGQIGKSNETNTTNIYSVDEKGSIIIDSIKDSLIFEIAQKKDSNNSGKLEFAELSEFLEETKVLRYHKGYSLYYEEKDDNSNPTKKCFFAEINEGELKGKKVLITFSYNKEGKANSLIYQQNKNSWIKVDLHTGKAISYTDDNEEGIVSDPIDKTTCLKYRMLGNESICNPSSQFDRFLYRLTNWDWD